MADRGFDADWCSEDLAIQGISSWLSAQRSRKVLNSHDKGL